MRDRSTTHLKLVRDRIPEQLAERGVAHRIRTLGADEFEPALRAKLGEEVAEYLATRTRDGHDIEELADVLEVVYGLASLGGASPADLEAVRVAKAARSGSFSQRVFLIDTADSPARR